MLPLLVTEISRSDRGHLPADRSSEPYARAGFGRFHPLPEPSAYGVAGVGLLAAVLGYRRLPLSGNCADAGSVVRLVRRGFKQNRSCGDLSHAARRPGLV